MKKLLGIVVAVVAVLAMTVPAMAQTSVTTGVTILSGTGVAPMVKAKWETTSATVADAESGDTSHSIAGTQVLPNIGWQVSTNVTFWAIVTDRAGVANLDHIYADVFYPGSGSDPGPDGSLKFELELFRVNDPLTTLQGYFNAAYVAGLTTINSETPLFPEVTGTQRADILEELIQGSAALYRGTYHFDNCQRAGNYLVTINAVNGQNVHAFLSNTLQWLALTAAEWDFTAITYGSVAIGVHKQIDGNFNWDQTPGEAPRTPSSTAGRTAGATIRNIGNTYLKMTVKQDDMGLGKTNINGVDYWNVHYDARLGSDANGMVNYDPSVAKPGSLTPFTPTTLLQVLRLCAVDKVDFSILVDKDSVVSANHIYAGTMVLGAVVSAGPATNGIVYIPPANVPNE